MFRSGLHRRIALVAISIAMLPFGASADIQNGLGNGYSDNFNYSNASLTSAVPIDATKWQTFPIDQNGNAVPQVWMVQQVQTSGIGTTSNTITALRETKTQTVPADPIAFVRNGNWQNMVIQVRAAYDGPSVNSGVGVVFRSPVDPSTGLADRNNFYLFTEVNSVANPRNFVTGRAFALFKRVGGAYFLAGFTNTYMNFLAQPGSSNEFHTLKVVVSDNHILGYADNHLVIDMTDTPGDDVNGIFSMPGPMLANGTVGVRTSGTKAIFDDFVVLASPGYEGRASAIDAFGQVGTGSTGIAIQQTVIDTGFQYHDHDFPTGTSTEGTAVGPTSTGNGITVGAVLQTSGHDGVTRSSAEIVGATGLFSEGMPDGSTVDVSIAFDTISAAAQASCDERAAQVQLLNFTYQIVIRNTDGIPLVNEGKVTQIVPPPNTVVSDPQSNGGYVKIVANSQVASSKPMRMDVHAIEIDFLQQPFNIQNPSNNTSAGNTGITFATVTIGNVLAGRICETPI